MAKSRVRKSIPAAQPAISSAIEVDDGEFSILVRGGPNEGRTFVLDVIEVRLASERIEEQFGVKKAADLTGPILRCLATEYAAFLDGHCSPSVAYQIWTVGVQRWNAATKKAKSTQS